MLEKFADPDPDAWLNFSPKIGVLYVKKYF